jgi:hypothetical protein
MTKSKALAVIDAAISPLFSAAGAFTGTAAGLGVALAAVVPTIAAPDADVVTPAASRKPNPPRLTKSDEVVDNAVISVAAGKIWDGGGKLYRGRIAVNKGAIARNFRYFARPGTSDRIELYGGTVEDFRIEDDSRDGIWGTGKCRVERGEIATVNQYPLFFETADADVIDVNIDDPVEHDAGSISQSVDRWGKSTVRHLRVRIRAKHGKAISRGDGPLISYDSCDIEAPTITHAPWNPLGEVNGGKGRGVVEFSLSTGVWVADDLVNGVAGGWEKCRAAMAAAKSRGVTDRRQLVRAAAAVATRGGKPCPALSDADCDRTLADRDAMIRLTGRAVHKNTRIVALDLSPEAGSLGEFDPDCDLTLTNLLGAIKNTYPDLPWSMTDDPQRASSRLIINCPVTTTGGLGTKDLALAAQILKGSTGSLNKKAIAA